MGLTCSWRLVDATVGVPNALPQDMSVLNGDSVPTYLFKQANGLNLTVMRIFGTAEVDSGVRTCEASTLLHLGYDCKP